MDRNSSTLLLINHAGWKAIIPAAPCLAFGVGGLYAFAWLAARGGMTGNPLGTFGCLLFGLFFGYIALGFLFYAKCTLLDKDAGTAEHWIRFVNKWQKETAKFSTKAKLNIWKTQHRGTKLMLRARPESICLWQADSWETVWNKGNEVSRYLGVPLLEDK